ncbi:MAG: DNA mismatch repair protein MutS, partial [Thermodesulfobacteriota bacterium]|nr:DNA mismatch repair protein MutS [Thermodesulfobacteriota bacterium]
RLADWISFPLMDPARIDARLDAVGEIKGERDRLYALRGLFKPIPDMERIIGRISANRASPRDICALCSGLEQAPALRDLLKGAGSTLVCDIYDNLDPLDDISGCIRRTIVPDPPVRVSDGNVIRDHVDNELDELRSIKRDSREWIAAMEARQRELTGINTLKIGYNRVFGYYIEVSKVNAAKVPQTYIQKQSLANAERFITPELKEYEARILGAQDVILKIEQRIFNELRGFIVEGFERLHRMIEALSRLDVICCLCIVAMDNAYSRPEVSTDRGLEIKNGRHPVVEKVLGPGLFVSNHLGFDADRDTIHMITGPNMAGKSTYMRQVALICIMAQMGSFVPADKARIGVVDRIFTRIGALDNLSAGQSTFLVEMSETACILNNATAQSLVILDEIGRGTSTHDGMSLAWAVAEYLDKRHVRTFFATHYHELSDLARRHQGIKNFHMSVEDSGTDIVFLRVLKRGATGKSYGIHVAKLAGIPEDVVHNAGSILSRISKKAGSVPKAFSSGPIQTGLFDQRGYDFGYDDIINEIKEIDIENMRPIDALNRLSAIKDRINGDQGH